MDGTDSEDYSCDLSQSDERLLPIIPDRLVRTAGNPYEIAGIERLHVGPLQGLPGHGSRHLNAICPSSVGITPSLVHVVLDLEAGPVGENARSPHLPIHANRRHQTLHPDNVAVTQEQVQLGAVLLEPGPIDP